MTSITIRQNKLENLEKLAAQRQIYSDIKILMVWALFFGAIVPVTTSIIGFILNNDFLSNHFKFQKMDISVWVGFIGFFSTLFVEVLNNRSVTNREKAAKIQELFDVDVFKISWSSIEVGEKPLHEEIFSKKTKFLKKNTLDMFKDWYSTKVSNFSYPKSIVFC